MDFGLGRMLLQVATYTEEGSSRTIRTNEMIELLSSIFEGFDNLWTCRFTVNPSIGFVLELIGPKPTVFVCQFCGRSYNKKPCKGL